MERILVVGTNPADREVRALVVEFGGYRCVTVGSLEEALNLLQKDLFDLVVTELKLDGHSPEHIVERFKCVSPEMAVIALTQNGETVQSADEVLPIPCSHEDLVCRINRVLGKLVGVKAKTRREKRRFPRYSVNLPCSIRDLKSAEASEGFSINISRGGLYVVVAAGNWKVGNPVECVLQLPSSVISEAHNGIRTQGKVVRVGTDERKDITIAVAIERFEFINLASAEVKNWA
jgi:CheY-like chemotaxis protein